MDTVYILLYFVAFFEMIMNVLVSSHVLYCIYVSEQINDDDDDGDGDNYEKTIMMMTKSVKLITECSYTFYFV